MKLALALCMALLLVVLIQAEDEMRPETPLAGTRISGGRPANPRQFPYMAYVVSEGSSWKRPTHCVGSLITRNAVLTTAWCVTNQTKHTVRLGSVFRTANDNNAWKVVSILSLEHPRYDFDSGTNNLAIIVLPKKAPLNEFIQLVDLPSSPHIGSFVGCDGIVSGWGQTSPGSAFLERLHWGEVIVITNDICKKFFPGKVTDLRVCAAPQYLLYGDDGSPLVMKIEGRYIQIGIHCRRDSKNYNPSKPAIYERVSSYIQWIKKHTGAD